MDENAEFPWLDGSEELFAKSDRAGLNVDVAYCRELAFYAHGYRRSAEMLFDAISAQRQYADAQYFALAFLWRQALELTLKSLIADLDELEGVGRFRGPPRQYDPVAHSPLLAPVLGHDLRKLWADVAPRLRQVFPHQPETDWAGRVIEQFHDVDPGAEGFRYPTKLRDGSRTLDSLPRVVNLSDLDRTMRALLNVLDAALSETGARLDYMREASREAG